MNLKVRRTPDGLPRIEIRFDQDTSDSEPYMVLDAYGFETDDEIAGTLMDVAQSLHNNVPVEKTYSTSTLGRLSDEGQAWQDTLIREQRPGETLLDTERRLIRDHGAGTPEPKHVPFNPKPRGSKS